MSAARAPLMVLRWHLVVRRALLTLALLAVLIFVGFEALAGLSSWLQLEVVPTRQQALHLALELPLPLVVG